jgi:hypothetical protein
MDAKSTGFLPITDGPALLHPQRRGGCQMSDASERAKKSEEEASRKSLDHLAELEKAHDKAAEALAQMSKRIQNFRYEIEEIIKIQNREGGSK